MTVTYPAVNGGTLEIVAGDTIRLVIRAANGRAEIEMTKANARQLGADLIRLGREPEAAAEAQPQPVTPLTGAEAVAS